VFCLKICDKTMVYAHIKIKKHSYETEMDHQAVDSVHGVCPVLSGQNGGDVPDRGSFSDTAIL
jgi:hypothetical protein